MLLPDKARSRTPFLATGNNARNERDVLQRQDKRGHCARAHGGGPAQLAPLQVKNVLQTVVVVVGVVGA